jgi:hypothetical protein
MKDAMIKSEYAANSAVTFFMLGLGIGTFLAILFNPNKEGAGRGAINGWRTAAVQSRRVQPLEEQDRAA